MPQTMPACEGIGPLLLSHPVLDKVKLRLSLVLIPDGLGCNSPLVRLLARLRAWQR